MSDMPEPSVEKAIVSEFLNPNIVAILLLGAYTVVYLGTAYVYLTQKTQSSQRRVVLTAITLLYLLYVCYAATGWYQIEYFVITHGETRDSMFLALSMPPVWLNITGNGLMNAMVVIADGLMIWRCYHMWGGSWRVIVVPTVLTVSEIGLLIGLFIANFKQNGNAFNIINTAIYFTSAAATTMSTLLIGWRFHITASASASLQSSNRKTLSGRYGYILLILIESAAIYALFLIVLAILTVIPLPDQFAAPRTQATIYLSNISSAVTGIAPTILVARVVMAKSPIHAVTQGPVDFTQQISGLRFQSQLPGGRHIASTLGVMTGPMSLDDDHVCTRSDRGVSMDKEAVAKSELV